MNTQWLPVSLSKKTNKLFGSGYCRCCFYYLQNNDNFPVGTPVIISDRILYNSGRGDFVLHRAFRRGILSGGILSGYRTMYRLLICSCFMASASTRQNSRHDRDQVPWNSNSFSRRSTKTLKLDISIGYCDVAVNAIFCIYKRINASVRSSPLYQRRLVISL